MKKGADKTLTDSYGKTPLQLAWENNNLLTAILLKDGYLVEKTMLFSSAIISIATTAVTIIAALEITNLTPKAIIGTTNTKLALGISIPVIILGLCALSLASYMTYSKIDANKKVSSVTQYTPEDHTIGAVVTGSSNIPQNS